jgi:drug/metabolite transporter (DMT)-like permease
MNWVAATLLSAFFLGIYALKHLPLSLGAPIRATSPLLSLFGAVVMSLRRANTLIAFLGGLILFKEVNGWKKLPAVLGILIGIVVTILGRR